MFGKKKKQEQLLANLDQEFVKIQQKYHLPAGDFPNPEKFKQNLALYDMDKFKSLKEDLVDKADEALSVDLPRLMSRFPMINPELEESQRNPFEEFGSGDMPPSYWDFAAVDKAKYTPMFHELHPREGKVGGAAVKPVLMDSGLPNDVLAQTWRLADFDGDGYLDLNEFCIAMHLIKAHKSGAELPEKLPSTLMPNTKI